MVQPWWAAAAAVPVIVVKGITSARSRSKKDTVDPKSYRDEDGADNEFVCERVCTSDRMLRRMGSLSKEPTRNNCVMVCGVSAVDACTEACQRTVCANAHQVPAWNEGCLKRCTTECLKGRGT